MVMPAPEAPLRSGAKLFTYRERFYFLRRMFRREISAGRVRLSVLERRLPAPHYTIQTLEALRKHCEFIPTIVIGADQAEKLSQWHRSADLISGWSFLIFGRPGAVLKTEPGMQAETISKFAYDISSTSLRVQLLTESATHRFQMAKEIAENAGKDV